MDNKKQVIFLLEQAFKLNEMQNKISESFGHETYFLGGFIDDLQDCAYDLLGVPADNTLDYPDQQYDDNTFCRDCLFSITGDWFDQGSIETSGVVMQEIEEWIASPDGAEKMG